MFIPSDQFLPSQTDLKKHLDQHDERSWQAIGQHLETSQSHM